MTPLGAPCPRRWWPCTRAASRVRSGLRPGGRASRPSTGRAAHSRNRQQRAGEQQPLGSALRSERNRPELRSTAVQINLPFGHPKGAWEVPFYFLALVHQHGLESGPWVCRHEGPPGLSHETCHCLPRAGAGEHVVLSVRGVYGLSIRKPGVEWYRLQLYHDGTMVGGLKVLRQRALPK